MWDKPSINRLPGDRLHLRHGPITIVLKVWGDPDVVRQAQRLVTRHFPKILPELASELEDLRKPLKKAMSFDGTVAQRMADAALPFADVYAPIFYVLAGMMVIGLIANLLVTPVADKFIMTPGELAREKQVAHEKSVAEFAKTTSISAKGLQPTAVLAWLIVLVPIGYGIWSTIQKAAVLFG